MKLVRRISFLLIVLVLLFSASSCKKTREITSGAIYTDEKSLIETTLNNELKFNRFQSRISVSFFDGNKTMSATAQLKIVNKERLQISVQPLLGIEVFKAEFTNDSVKLVDKINKRYVSESIAYYKGKLPVEINIATIQALFMNYLFVPEKGNMEISDLKKFNWAMGINGDLSGKFKNSRQYNLSYKLNNKARHTNTFISDKKENNYLDWRYSQFQDLKGSVFPYASKVSYKSQTKNISLDIKYSKIQIDEKMNISFDIPSSYRKIEFSALINSLF